MTSWPSARSTPPRARCHGARRRLHCRLRRPAHRLTGLINSAPSPTTSHRCRARPPSCCRASRGAQRRRLPPRRLLTTNPRARPRPAESPGSGPPGTAVCQRIVHTHTLTSWSTTGMRSERRSQPDDGQLDKWPTSPIRDPDDFIREVTDLIWVDRASPSSERTTSRTRSSTARYGTPTTVTRSSRAA